MKLPVLMLADLSDNYEAQFYADTPGINWQKEAEKVAVSTVQVTKTTTQPIVLGEGGGLAVRFKKLD